MRPMIDFISTYRWAPLVAVGIFALVRLLKSDTRIPIHIPARWRPWLAIVLGQIGALLERRAAGLSWSQAMAQAVAEGLATSVGAMLGHDVIVELLRQGKELPLGWLTAPPTKPEETAPLHPRARP